MPSTILGQSVLPNLTLLNGGVFSWLGSRVRSTFHLDGGNDPPCSPMQLADEIS